MFLRRPRSEADRSDAEIAALDVDARPVQEHLDPLPDALDRDAVGFALADLLGERNRSAIVQLPFFLTWGRSVFGRVLNWGAIIVLSAVWIGVYHAVVGFLRVSTAPRYCKFVMN